MKTIIPWICFALILAGVIIAAHYSYRLKSKFAHIEKDSGQPIPFNWLPPGKYKILSYCKVEWPTTAYIVISGLYIGVRLVKISGKTEVRRRECYEYMEEFTKD